MVDLLSLFQELSAYNSPNNIDASANRFVARPIPGHNAFRLAKDTLGFPTLLLSADKSYVRRRSHPIALENLRVLPDVECRITHPDGFVEEGRFTIISCISDSQSLQAYFLRVASTVLLSVSAEPSELEVVKTVDSLVELFQALIRPPRKSVQGLWAELLIIDLSRKPNVLLDAWHTLPDDIYDFSSGTQRIEVKSASEHVRRHHFTLEQLNPPAGTIALIASLFVNRSGAGLSLGDLLNRVRDKVAGTTDLAFILERVVAGTLGHNWEYGLEERFDYETARQSLAFYDASNVPSVDPKLREGVSHVRFQSDLSRSEPVKLAEYKQFGSLFAALRG